MDPELHEQTVPRRFVHRASVSEVMLTGWRQTGADRFLLGAQWPRTHSFYRPIAGCYDPLMLAETIRQSAMLISHAGYGVPTDYPFLLWSLSYRADPAAMAVGQTPANLTISATCQDVRFRRGIMAGMQYETVIHRGATRLGVGSLRMDCMAPDTYARLRAPYLAQRLLDTVPPQGEYQDVKADSVLAPTGEQYTWRLQADRRHPVLFDHPVDHVPGMVIVEAMRQAANSVVGVTGVAPFELETNFVRYAELHQPVFVKAFPGPAGRNGEMSIRIAVEQDGASVATGQLNVRRTAREETRMPLKVG
ncbi:ScbA/BarX family gamma-butyrolactone biosynthesis protein [Kitasatospora sp. NPDC002040]|uniref:ScbA/BarX family gamma-butyrolactone biosynthesis protein n=1 Tax=Kitasatospora sp. NPDC002040 TaxID=3154661 RepID=UPI003320ADC0